MSLFLKVLCGELIFAVMSIGIWFFVSIDDYQYGRTNYSMKVTAKTVKDWYSLNPDRYFLRSNRVYIKVNVSDNIDDCYIVELKNFIEYIKYTRFLNNIRKEEKIAKKNKLNKEALHEHTEILNLIQSDIDKMRIKANREFIEVANTYKNIQDSLDEKENKGVFAVSEVSQ